MANREASTHALRQWTMLACSLLGLSPQPTTTAPGRTGPRCTAPERERRRGHDQQERLHGGEILLPRARRQRAQLRQLSCAGGRLVDDAEGLARAIRADRRDGPGVSPERRRDSPLADVSTRQAREKAYGMLLSKGLIRIGIGIPAGAEFELVKVDDPYGFASAAELSLFRRPLASTNLRFLSTVMWDGRETFRDDASSDCLFNTTTCFASLRFDLADQANSATIGPRAGDDTADDRAARGHRRLRARSVHGAAAGRPRRSADGARRQRRPGVPLERCSRTSASTTRWSATTAATRASRRR